jgi:NADH dehydrogenase [ubiquinone] 1 alpha subcomplex assembly factor 5
MDTILAANPPGESIAGRTNVIAAAGAAPARMRYIGMSSATQGPADIFDRALLRARRARAAAEFGAHDFLFREIAERLAERVSDVRRDFPLALDFGCRTGLFTGAATRLAPGKIGTIIQCDLAPEFARMAHAANGATAIAADEEALPFAASAFDLAVSGGALHAVNDVPGTLAQIRHALAPDGLFLGALIGGETLNELRTALLAAEAEVEGGASPRVAPFAQLSDAAGLLQRAGFALPVADIDRIDVTYENAFRLMADLRGMGETNVRHDRRRTPTRRATLMRAADIYTERFAGADGRIPATFEVFFLTGWAPAASQPRPLRPGSAQARLADALETAEQSAGEAASAGRTGH